MSMESILVRVNNPEARTAFLTRALPDAIGRLEADVIPRWGRMNAQQMMEHLIWAFELSTGTQTVSCDIPANRQEQLKAWLYDDRPSPRDFRNPQLPAEPLPLRHSSITEAKTVLQRELDRFIANRDKDSGTLHTHPLFGRLSAKEWERTHVKHAYHHLVQFDLIREM